MKTLIGLGVVASVAMLGCATDDADPATSVDEAALTFGGGNGGITARPGHCPDEGCGTGNGAGIYTDENGDATLDPAAHAMLVRFYNDGSGMRAYVRYDNGSPPNDTHVVVAYPAYAMINGVQYYISSIEESLTVPTITLGNGAVYSGDNITTVRIFIDTTDPGKLAAGERTGYTIAFGNPITELMLNTHDPLQPSDTMHEFYVRVSPGVGYNPNNSSVYCRTRTGGPDPVVFQRDIWVNASSSDVVRSPGTMTFSCRHGGIATARWWGYIYGNNLAQMNMFATALHMKRASYCGDGKFYTIDGTQIAFQDVAGINHMPMQCSHMEAEWGYDQASDTFRATCYVPVNRRHTDLQTYGLANFNGHCADGHDVPVCTSCVVPSGTLLVDQLGPTVPSP